MEFLILGGCVILGAALYLGVIRPLVRMIFIPLTSRIPTGREYRPDIGARS